MPNYHTSVTRAVAIGEVSDSARGVDGSDTPGETTGRPSGEPTGRRIREHGSGSVGPESDGRTPCPECPDP